MAIDAVQTIKNLLDGMDNSSVSKVYKHAGKLLGTSSRPTLTTGKGKASGGTSLYFKTITGIDPSHSTGWAVDGAFLKPSEVEKTPGRIMVVAKGYPKPTVLIGHYDKGVTSKFSYPSGSDGTINDFTIEQVFDNWNDVIKHLDATGVPHVTVKPVQKS